MEKGGHRIFIEHFTTLYQKNKEQYLEYLGFKSVKLSNGGAVIDFYKDTPENERKTIEKTFIPDEVRMNYKEALKENAPGHVKIDEKIEKNQQFLRKYYQLPDTDQSKSRLIKKRQEIIEDLEREKSELNLPLTDAQIRETQEYAAHRQTSQNILNQYRKLYQSIEHIAEDSVQI
jgi:hypothetical protein